MKKINPFKEDYPLNFYVIQLVSFLYMAYRFASRDYSIYGMLTSEYFDYPRKFIFEIWPIPLLEITTFQFVYKIYDFRSAELILSFQAVLVFCSLLGALGIKPKVNAIICFLLGIHVTGLSMSSNADMDAGCLIFMTMAIFTLLPKESFYRLNSPLNLNQKKWYYGWPVFFFIMMISAYYFTTGLNKIVDEGILMPFNLHLEYMAESKLYNSLTFSHRWNEQSSLALLISYPVFSIIGGFVTIYGELGFILALYSKFFRYSCALSMIVFHVIVFFSTGINFLGNSIMLLLCFNYNSIYMFFKKKLKLN